MQCSTVFIRRKLFALRARRMLYGHAFILCSHPVLAMHDDMIPHPMLDPFWHQWQKGRPLAVKPRILLCQSLVSIEGNLGDISGSLPTLFKFCISVATPCNRIQWFELLYQRKKSIRCIALLYQARNALHHHFSSLPSYSRPSRSIS